MAQTPPVLTPLGRQIPRNVNEQHSHYMYLVSCDREKKKRPCLRPPIPLTIQILQSDNLAILYEPIRTREHASVVEINGRTQVRFLRGAGGGVVDDGLQLGFAGFDVVLDWDGACWEGVEGFSLGHGWVGLGWGIGDV